jgi:nitrogenase molybdenum-iron protein alpha/beta subunit
MTKTSSNTPHRPDSLAGAISAFEGIHNACALINSPLGCRNYLAYLIQIQDPQATSLNSDAYMTEFHFGLPRAPCTFIDEYDYVNSAEPKIKKALTYLSGWNQGLVGVINAPGTSLIGDDLTGIVRKISPKFKTVTIESTSFTGTFADGFKKAVIEILKTVTKESSGKIPKSVNLVGPNIFHYNWENNVEEIKKTFELMGIRTLSTICAGEDLSKIEQAAKAELNVVLSEEYGDTIAKFLERNFGIPALGIKEPSPFGLMASEQWFGSIAKFFNLHSEIVESESRKIRMKCYRTLERLSLLTGGLKGKTFAVFGDSSTVAPLTMFLHKYLGMYPEIAGLREVGPHNKSSIESYLSENSLDTTLLFSPDQYEIQRNLLNRNPHLIYGSVIEERISKASQNKHQAVIPISHPYSERVLLTFRPTVGFNGALTLVEDTINSIKVVEGQV